MSYDSPLLNIEKIKQRCNDTNCWSEESYDQEPHLAVQDKHDLENVDRLQGCNKIIIKN